MNPYLFLNVADGALRCGMIAAVPKFQHASATAIAHIAEFDARRLYVPEGFPSMARFCVAELGLTEQVALKLIRVGRTARQFPEIFLALADGRLSPSAVIMLKPWLTRENAAGLLAAAARKSCEEIRGVLATWFPGPDLAMRVEPVTGLACQVSARTVGGTPTGGETCAEVSARTPAPAPRPRVTPLSPERYGVQFTMVESTHQAMQCLEQLLGRKLNAEDLDAALRAGFEAMAAKLEKNKFAATDRPRQQRKPGKSRHIPAAVKRQVRARDQGRCTFVAENGRRCEARSHLEFDHIEPVSCGGKATVENIRLRCRAHNQYEAEQAFGAGFIHEKRERARRGAAIQRAQRAAVDRRARVGARTRHAEAETVAAARAEDQDVIPWLRQLGFRSQEARRAAVHCASTVPDAPLETRVKVALSFLSPPARVSSGRQFASSPG